MTEPSNGPLRLGLFILRLTTGLFFLIWSIDKIVDPAHAQRVFEKFYLMEIVPSISIGLGVAQTLVVLAFLAGLWRAWTTGALLAMHTVSVASTWARLIDPYAAGNILFWTAVPVWGGLLLLWLCREQDTLFTVGGGRRYGRDTS